MILHRHITQIMMQQLVQFEMHTGIYFKITDTGMFALIYLLYWMMIPWLTKRKSAKWTHQWILWLIQCLRSNTSVELLSRLSLSDITNYQSGPRTFGTLVISAQVISVPFLSHFGHNANDLYNAFVWLSSDTSKFLSRLSLSGITFGSWSCRPKSFLSHLQVIWTPWLFCCLYLKKAMSC